MSKALEKWYEKENSFPCECLCKFKPNDEKYVVATIVKFSPNNGWYEFVGNNKNTYSIAIPIAELKAQEAKSCDGCKYENKSDSNECFYCSRDCNYRDNYKPKDT